MGSCREVEEQQWKRPACEGRDRALRRRAGEEVEEVKRKVKGRSNAKWPLHTWGNDVPHVEIAPGQPP